MPARISEQQCWMENDNNVPFCSTSLPRAAEMGSPVLLVDFYEEPARRSCRVEMATKQARVSEQRCGMETKSRQIS